MSNYHQSHYSHTTPKGIKVFLCDVPGCYFEMHQNPDGKVRPVAHGSGPHKFGGITTDEPVAKQALSFDFDISNLSWGIG